MSTVIRAIAIAGGAMAAVVGGWGIINHRTLSTGELQSMTLWLGLGLLAGGAAIIALGLGGGRVPAGR